jgi:hypothetical protein
VREGLGFEEAFEWAVREGFAVVGKYEGGGSPRQG